MAGFELLRQCRTDNAKEGDRTGDTAERDREASDDRVKAGKAGQGVREELPRSLWLRLER
jgi:hypothetical protein